MVAYRHQPLERGSVIEAGAYTTQRHANDRDSKHAGGVVDRSPQSRYSVTWRCWSYDRYAEGAAAPSAVRRGVRAEDGCLDGHVEQGFRWRCAMWYRLEESPRQQCAAAGAN